MEKGITMTQKEKIKGILKDVFKGRLDDGESVDSYLERRAKQIIGCVLETKKKVL